LYAVFSLQIVISCISGWFSCVTGDGVPGGDVGAEAPSNSVLVAAEDAMGIGEAVGAEDVECGVFCGDDFSLLEKGGGVEQPDTGLEDQFVGLGAL
jgi:hypothetical protein